jgi:hypothetical protein
MHKLAGRQREAIEAVARHFGAAWAPATDGSAGAVLTVGKRRIAVAVVKLPGCTPRLRLDRVVLAMARRLHDALRDSIPDGQTVMITITAPIRQAGKTAGDIVARLPASLQDRGSRLEMDAVLYGNRIRAGLLKGVAAHVPKAILLVHNPDDAADVAGSLLRLTQSLLAHSGAGGGGGRGAGVRHAKRRAAGRWLVLAPAAGKSQAATLRHILAQAGMAAAFAKVLLADARGRVEVLAETTSGWPAGAAGGGRAGPPSIP